MRNDDSDLGKVPALAAADDFNPAGVEIRSGFGEFLEEAFANRIASRDGHRDTKDIALRRAEEANREQAYAGKPQDSLLVRKFFHRMEGSKRKSQWPSIFLKK